MNNPIRKKRSWSCKAPDGGPGMGVPGFWYAICPSCNEKVKSLWGALRVSGYTRKQAKDALHRHKSKCSGGPGGEK